MRLSRFLFVFVCFCLFSCVRTIPKPETPRTALSVVDSPAFSDDLDIKSLLNAIDKSILSLSKRSQTQEVIFGPLTVTNAELIKSLKDFRKAVNTFGLSNELYNYIEKNYYILKPPAKDALVTGYFEASLKGSRKKSEKFSYPLYKRPPELVTINLSQFPILSRFEGLPATIRGRVVEDKILPYYSREEIDYKDALKDRQLELLWVEDPIDAFFLHIQGSGIVTLDSGEKVRVNYADKNGQPYRAIGRLLVEQGILSKENVSMQSIKSFLRNNPGKAREVFTYNPSYIFFREVKEGPIGSLGVPLTPNRSIATDKSLFPQGALAFIKTEKPVFNESARIIGWKKYSRFVLNQDTGGAIKGTAKVDLFTGYGPESEQVAGVMKQSGDLYFLIKKNFQPLYTKQQS